MYPRRASNLPRNGHTYEKDRSIFYGFIALLVTLGLFAGYPQLISSVWLPHQQLKGPDHQLLDVGYVLSDTNGTITPLQTGSRDIKLYKDSMVESRAICIVRYFYPFWRGTYAVETFAQWIAQRNKKSSESIPSC